MTMIYILTSTIIELKKESSISSFETYIWTLYFNETLVEMAL